MKDYTILAKPRITGKRFEAILRNRQSPAAPEAPYIFQILRAKGIDPALALAQFAAESGYGKKGRAFTNKSWGNIRKKGVFIKYATWSAGAQDYANLIAGPNYAGGTIFNTALTMPYGWAPSADNNRPHEYGQLLVKLIRLYRLIDTPSVSRTTAKGNGWEHVVIEDPTV